MKPITYKEMEEMEGRIFDIFAANDAISKGHVVKIAVHQAIQARKHLRECNAMDNLISSGKFTTEMEKNSEAFIEALNSPMVQQTEHPYIGYTDYKILYNSIEDFNHETQLKFHETCTCKKRVSQI